jgi:gliding motility-associated-like protein
VFDRWGHLVFQSRDHTKGWDGSLRNKGDVIMKEDSYNYKLKFKDLDGNLFEKSGTVTLLH